MDYQLAQQVVGGGLAIFALILLYYSAINNSNQTKRANYGRQFAFLVLFGSGVFLATSPLRGWYISLMICLLFIGIISSVISDCIYGQKGSLRINRAGWAYLTSFLLFVAFVGLLFFGITIPGSSKETARGFLILGAFLPISNAIALYKIPEKKIALIRRLWVISFTCLWISMIPGAFANRPLETIAAWFLASISLKFAWESISSFERGSKASVLQKSISPISAVFCIALLVTLIMNTADNPLFNFQGL